IYGVDYNEIFSSVVKMTTIRLVLSIIAAENLHLEQSNVKTAFLHGDLDEDIYMTQPEGFQSAGKEENLVCKLKKSLYGLKQSPRQWLRHGRNQEAQDVTPPDGAWTEYVSKGQWRWRSSDDGEARGGEWWSRSGRSMEDLSFIYFGVRRSLAGRVAGGGGGGRNNSPEKMEGMEEEDDGCVWKVLEKFNIKDVEARCQPLGDHFKLSKKQAPKTEASRRRMAKVPYASAVGSVMYTMEAVKWLLRYLKGISKATLCFSRKEKCVAMSTTESEYMDIAEAGKELVWLKNFLEELDKAQTECVLFCDNQSAIQLTKNPVFHGRMKHIKIRYHYIRELVSKGTLSLKKILGVKNLADMLTKV
ncbi:retrovirus-related pol polyprotein from transposon TNT 1-94, partial [Tanacetum coccineum]